MRIRRKKESINRKKGLLITSVLIAGVVGYGAYAAYNPVWPFASENGQTIDAGVDDSGQAPTGSDGNKQPGKIDSPKTPVDSSPSDNEKPETKYNELGVSITNISKPGGKVRVNTLIEAVTSKGTCTLKLINDGKVVQKSAGIQPLSSSSTCKGFGIPIGELSNGTWSITLTVVIGNLSGSATSQVTIP